MSLLSDLFPQDKKLLYEIVSEKIQSLGQQIRHTDNGVFKSKLKREREELEKLLGKLVPEDKPASSTPALNGHHPQILIALIQNELGAVETYHEMVLSAVSEPVSARNVFRQLEQEHQEAVQALSRHLGFSHSAPASPGIWRRFLAATHDTFKVLDNPDLMASLKRGELKLAMQYDDALKEKFLGKELEDLIKATLHPRAKAHAQIINRFIAAQTGGSHAA